MSNRGSSPPRDLAPACDDARVVRISVAALCFALALVGCGGDAQRFTVDLGSDGTATLRAPVSDLQRARAADLAPRPW